MKITLLLNVNYIMLSSYQIKLYLYSSAHTATYRVGNAIAR